MKLRLLHAPTTQNPNNVAKPFIIEVDSVEEAEKLEHLLRSYDAFQYHNWLRTSFSSTTDLQVWNEEHGAWITWQDGAFSACFSEQTAK